MATSKATKSEEPKSAIVRAQLLDEDGKPTGVPHYASATAPWILEGLAAGTVKIVEEVPADDTQVSAQGDAAGTGSGSTGS